MLKVEEYFYINNEDIKFYLKNKNLSDFQGRNIFLKKDLYSLDELKEFFSSVFNFVNKISVEGKGSFYIVSDKFSEEVVEPYQMEQKGDELHNDVNLISEFICSLNKNYEV